MFIITNVCFSHNQCSIWKWYGHLTLGNNITSDMQPHGYHWDPIIFSAYLQFNDKSWIIYRCYPVCVSQSGIVVLFCLLLLQFSEALLFIQVCSSLDWCASLTKMWYPVIARNMKYTDSKVHGANMGPLWGRQDPGGPHVGPMNVGPMSCEFAVSFVMVSNALCWALFCLDSIQLYTYMAGLQMWRS